MRNLVALAALSLFVASSCGDDTTSTGSNDMAAAAADLATGADMAKRNCAQVAVCANNCTSQACITACAAGGTSDAQTRFGVFGACVAAACGPGDGGTGSCPAPPDNSTTCQTCLKTTGQAAQSDPAAPCHAQLTDCLAH